MKRISRKWYPFLINEIYDARLFKATTWEELRRCAGDDAAMQSAVNMMYEYNEEESVRDMCRAREESLAFEAFIKAEKERFQAEMEEIETNIEARKNLTQ